MLTLPEQEINFHGILDIPLRNENVFSRHNWFEPLKIGLISKEIHEGNMFQLRSFEESVKKVDGAPLYQL